MIFSPKQFEERYIHDTALARHQYRLAEDTAKKAHDEAETIKAKLLAQKLAHPPVVKADSKMEALFATGVQAIEKNGN
jgi:hypothetical protein